MITARRWLVLTAVCALTGCATFTKYGVTRQMVEWGVNAAIAKEGLTAAVPPAIVNEVIDIALANERLVEIAGIVETNSTMQQRIEEVANKYLFSGKYQIPGLTLPTAPNATLPTGSLHAGFLLDDAKVRVMNKLSINADAKDYTALLKQQRDFGFNQILFFLLNEGDGGPVPTTFYRDQWFGDVDPARVEMMRSRIQEAKALGFHVQFWGFPDDSPTLRKATPDQIKGAYETMVAQFGDLADSWCVGLELDEWGETWWNMLWHKPDMTVIQGVVEILKATGKPVFVHFTSYKKIDLAHRSGADGLNAQFGWQDKPEEMTEAMEWINARKGKLRVVAGEFNRDSITPLATALATAAMAAGAEGTQTGRPAKTVDRSWKSIKWISENYSGAEDAGVVLTARCADGKVHFTNTAYSWPVKDGDLDAVACFFVWNGSQWEGGKFEWIRKGGQSVKDLKNIHEGYGGLKAPASGARVAFAWVSVDGKKRTNLAETVW